MTGLGRWLKRRRQRTMAARITAQISLYAQDWKPPQPLINPQGSTRLHQLLEDMDNDRDYR